MCANLAATQSSNSDEWSTPSWLFDCLDAEFHFDLDPCATDDNHLCDRYFTKEQDGLLQEWSGNVFVNPPFSGIAHWTEKAFREATEDRATVVMLVPARTDTRYWWRFTRQAEIRFLPGRLRFGGAPSGAPFPSAVAIFRQGMPDYNARVIWWNVRRDDG